MRIIADRGSMTVDNPTPIVDRNGAVHFLFQVNYAQLYYMRSDDDGQTFSTPVDITEAAHGFRRGWVSEKSETGYGWNVVAPGPGHGIQLAGGRLLATIWMSPNYRHRPSRIATIFSDDGGKTWKAGALIPQASVNPLVNPSEHVALELADGRVMTNLRSESEEHRRAAAYSPDGISKWTVPEFQPELFEAVCMASLVRLSESHRVCQSGEPSAQRPARSPELRRRQDVAAFEASAGGADRLLRYGGRAGRHGIHTLRAGDSR
jgi:sialidase-1